MILKALVYFSSTAYNTIALGSGFIALSIVGFFQIIYHAFLRGSLLFSTQDSRIVDQWLPFISIGGAAVGYLFLIYPLKGKVISTYYGNIYTILIWLIIIAQNLAYWFYLYFNNPLNWILWIAAFLILHALQFFVFKRSINFQQDHQDHIRKHNVTNPTDSCVFKTQEQSRSYHIWTGILFVVIGLCGAAQYLSNYITTDLDLWTGFIAMVAGTLVFIVAHFLNPT